MVNNSLSGKKFTLSKLQLCIPLLYDARGSLCSSGVQAIHMQSRVLHKHHAVYRMLSHSMSWELHSGHVISPPWTTEGIGCVFGLMWGVPTSTMTLNKCAGLGACETNFFFHVPIHQV